MNRRLPGIEKKINQIDENDVRIKIVGTIVSVDESVPMITIDDGTGIANVVVDKINNKVSDIVRVIGRVINLEPIEIRGEIVQNFPVDIEIYNKYLEIIQKVLNKQKNK